MNPSDASQNLDQQDDGASSPNPKEEVTPNNQAWQIDHTELDILLTAVLESTQ
jgi:hypothetical protein